MSAIKPVLVWSRVSTDEQGDTIATQRIKNQGTVAKFKLAPVETLEVVGESALPGKPRPIFLRKLANIGAGKYSAVVGTRFHRLFRSSLYLELFKEAIITTNTDLYIDGAKVDLNDRRTMKQARSEVAENEFDTLNRVEDSVYGACRYACRGFRVQALPFGRYFESVPKKSDDAICKPAIAKPGAKVYASKMYRLRVKQGKSWARVAEELGTPKWLEDEPSNAAAAANALRRRLTSMGGVWTQKFKMGQRPQADYEALPLAPHVRVEFKDGFCFVHAECEALLTDAQLQELASSGDYVRRPCKDPIPLQNVLRCSRCLRAVRPHKSTVNARVYLQHEPRYMPAGCPTAFARYDAIEFGVFSSIGRMLSNEKELETAVRDALARSVPDATELREELESLQARLNTDSERYRIGNTNLRTTEFDDVTLAGLARDMKRLNAAMVKTQAEIEEVKQKLLAAELPPEFESTVKETVRRLHRPYGLAQATREQKREIVEALFLQAGSLRKPVVGSKKAGLPYGVFLDVAEAEGETFVTWRAVGAFFTVHGTTSLIDDDSIQGLVEFKVVDGKYEPVWKDKWHPSKDDLKDAMAIATMHTRGTRPNP